VVVVSVYVCEVWCVGMCVCVGVRVCVCVWVWDTRCASSCSRWSTCGGDGLWWCLVLVCVGM
jgi:hypothetical protein